MEDNALPFQFALTLGHQDIPESAGHVDGPPTLLLM